MFAKKIEKLYNLRIRAGFTKISFESVGAKKQKELEFKKFLRKFELNLKRTCFVQLKAYTSSNMNTQNKVGSLFSIINQKQLQLLSQAFNAAARFGLVKKECLLHLTLLSIKLTEAKKHTLRNAFNTLKQNHGVISTPGQDKTVMLKKLLKEANIRQYYILKNAFSKWRGVIRSPLRGTTAKLTQERVAQAYLFSTLRSVFNSRMQMNKCYAFYKLKHHTKNLKGALNLYTMLEQKQWNRMRAGFENVLNFQKESPKQQELRESTPQAIKDKKRGLVRLLVGLEEQKLRMLSHAFKMIELFDIHKRNQKNLYINLALKSTLLIEERNKSFKKDTLNALFFNLEKSTLKRLYLERLMRRNHAKNLSFFFNKLKSEVANIKLSHSIVRLAIKDIILAVEKLSKVQRGRKALVFRKLNFFLWESHYSSSNKSSLTVSPNLSQFIHKDNLDVIESMNSVVSDGIEESKSKGMRLAFGLEKISAENKKAGFK